MKRIFVIGSLLLGLSISACDVLQGGPANIPTPTKTIAPPPPTQPPAPTPTPTPVPPTALPTSANPLDALTKAFRSFGGVKSFRARMTTTGLPTGTQETNLEFVTPDRFHMVSKQFEAILIGGAFYIKVGNQWQKIAQLSQGLDMSLLDPKKLEASLGVTTNVKFVGPDVLDGAPMLVYEYTTTIKGPPASTYKSKLWTAVSDGLPRKLESEPKAGQKTTVIYYDYNAAITIKAPIP